MQITNVQIYTILFLLTICAFVISVYIRILTRYIKYLPLHHIVQTSFFIGVDHYHHHHQPIAVHCWTQASLHTMVSTIDTRNKQLLYLSIINYILVQLLYLSLSCLYIIVGIQILTKLKYKTYTKLVRSLSEVHNIILQYFYLQKHIFMPCHLQFFISFLFICFHIIYSRLISISLTTARVCKAMSHT